MCTCSIFFSTICLQQLHQSLICSKKLDLNIALLDLFKELELVLFEFFYLRLALWNLQYDHTSQRMSFWLEIGMALPGQRGYRKSKQRYLWTSLYWSGPYIKTSI